MQQTVPTSAVRRAEKAQYPSDVIALLVLWRLRYKHFPRAAVKRAGVLEHRHNLKRSGAGRSAGSGRMPAGLSRIGALFNDRASSAEIGSGLAGSRVGCAIMQALTGGNRSKGNEADDGEAFLNPASADG